MIKREKYLNQIREFYDSDLVKVIVGIRRSGKSVILQSIIEEIRQTSDNIISLNFERAADLAKAPTAEELIEYVAKTKKSGICYVFLDEIQEVDNWHLAVKELRLDNNSVFITGSNSKLLSREILLLLSGRFVSFRLRPFVYQEIVSYCQMFNAEISPINYLIWGGFPGRLSLSGDQATRRFLEDLENTIVLNDLITRFKIRKPSIFKKIVSFVLVSNSRLYSARSIHNYVVKNIAQISLTTVIKYLDYLQDAYIIDAIAKYSRKKKGVLSYGGKIYNADVSFNSLSVVDNRFDLDHNLENIVYNELIYMGYDLKVFDANGREIDFIASKGSKVYYIQVAYSVVDPKAYEREFASFASLDNSHQKILITTDKVDYSTSTVRHISYEDFLALEDL